MNRQHDILCISSIDWDFIWQGRKQFVSCSAVEPNRVLFIGDTVWGLANWRRGTKVSTKRGGR